jgi:hypothetical protein
MIQKRNSFSVIYLVHSAKNGYETNEQRDVLISRMHARTLARMHAHRHNVIQTGNRGI